MDLTPDGKPFIAPRNRNPLMWWYRDAIESGLYDERALASLWVSLIEDDYDWAVEDGIEATPDEVAQAKRILARIASWKDN